MPLSDTFSYPRCHGLRGSTQYPTLHAPPGESSRRARPIIRVLVAEGAELKRYDYAADAWQGPPAEAVGWWKSQIPDRTTGRKHWAPNDVMLHFWDELAEQPDKQDMRYVLTLLLIRRRVFRLEEEKARRRRAGAVGGVLSAARGDVSGSRRPARAAADRSDSGGVGGAAAVEGNDE